MSGLKLYLKDPLIPLATTLMIVYNVREFHVCTNCVVRFSQLSNVNLCLSN